MGIRLIWRKPRENVSGKHDISYVRYDKISSRGMDMKSFKVEYFSIVIGILFILSAVSNSLFIEVDPVFNTICISIGLLFLSSNLIQFMKCKVEK